MDELAGLAGEARRRALNRFHLLQPHLDNDRPLKAVAAAGIPCRTAQRWVSPYRQFGLAALARKKRTDTGRHREISARLKEAVPGMLGVMCYQTGQLGHLGIEVIYVTAQWQ
jgi:putative transposase